MERKTKDQFVQEAAVRTKLILVNGIHAYSLLQNNKEIYRTFLQYRVSDPY